MRALIYSTYERFWHWLQAATIVSLSLSGFAIHFSAANRWVSFESAIRFHEAFAIVTIANGFLSLFYHLTTGAIRQFIPEPKDAMTMGLRLLRYYAVGIFHGEAHPFVHGPSTRLNLLQQVTYLAILNILLPVQVVTGTLLWQHGALAFLVGTSGGVVVVAAIHVAAAWLFVAFVVMHIYLTTTGSTPLEHVMTMVTGYAELHEVDSEVARLSQAPQNSEVPPDLSVVEEGSARHGT